MSQTLECSLLQKIPTYGPNTGYPHNGRADKDSYPHDGRADKDSYLHDGHADKDSYPHDRHNQYIIFFFFFVDNGTPSFTEDYLPCAIMLFTIKFG